MMPSLTDADLSGAVAKGDITPVFQPVVNVATGRISGAEVLARWRRPDGEQVAPDIFIPRAMACGQIVPLTLSLMAQVRRMLDALAPVGGEPLTVGFNAEQACLRSGRFMAACRAFMGGTPEWVRLAIEVTEREPAGLQALSALARLRKAGARVVLDDYGTGYAREPALRVLRPDIVKTDRSLTRLAGEGDPEGRLGRCLDVLGACPDVTILAEGVETEKEAAWLRGREITLMQGYGLYPPLSEPEFTALLAARRPEGRGFTLGQSGAGRPEGKPYLQAPQGQKSE